MAHSSDPTDRLAPEANNENSPLLRLPPELRNRIYYYVFGSSEAISPPRPQRVRGLAFSSEFDEDYPTYKFVVDNPVQTSILSVSRFVKAEAIEVLYGTKVIRGDIGSLSRMLRHQEVSSRVRWIETTNCDTRYSRVSGPREYQTFLLAAQDLPRIRSITILSDCLANVQQDKHISVVELARKLGIGPATCIDIGRWQLHGEFKGVQIANQRLVDMWPAVRATPITYNGIDDALTIVANLQLSEEAPNVRVWATHTSLRCWVDVQQQYLALLKSGRWAELEETAATGAFDEDEVDDDTNNDRTTYRFLHDSAGDAMWNSIDEYDMLKSGEHVFSELQPHSDSQLLNEASEFLALNTAGYYRMHTHPAISPEWDLCSTVWASCWAGTGKTTLEYMAEQQAIALSGGTSDEFVLDPSIQSEIPALRLLDRDIAMSWIKRSGLDDWMTDNYPRIPISESLKQLTCLSMAVSHYNLVDPSADPGYNNRRDQWAADLLRRYVLASGDLSDDDREAAMNTNISDLRLTVSVVLNIVKKDHGGFTIFKIQDSRRERPPADFDSDVHPLLGWFFGKLFADAFHKYCAECPLPLALARQWEEEYSLWPSLRES